MSLTSMTTMQTIFIYLFDFFFLWYNKVSVGDLARHLMGNQVGWEREAMLASLVWGATLDYVEFLESVWRLGVPYSMLLLMGCHKYLCRHLNGHLNDHLKGQLQGSEDANECTLEGNIVTFGSRCVFSSMAEGLGTEIVRWRAIHVNIKLKSIQRLKHWSKTVKCKTLNLLNIFYYKCKLR